MTKIDEAWLDEMHDHYQMRSDADANNVCLLIAEIRRLRAELADLAESWGDTQLTSKIEKVLR